MSNGIIASTPYKRSRHSSFIAHAKSAESSRFANAGEVFAETLWMVVSSGIIGVSGFKLTSFRGSPHGGGHEGQMGYDRTDP